ncbi:MAG: sugar O-acetyltransferase [Dinoroseobacter sp.]|nr:sugar O-acetyltransferase [Dinoroseobacter sp.]
MARAWEDMRAGLPYDPGDPDLVARRKRAQRLMQAYNHTVYGDDTQRAKILGELLGGFGSGCALRTPLHVDYGSNIFLGDGVFLNYGCTLLDVCDIRIGDRTQIGPYVQILTADHPRDAAARAAGTENGAPVVIGQDVWIGGGAIILPGKTIGNGAVVGAGAVVTRDVDPGQTVVGNPARPI